MKNLQSLMLKVFRGTFFVLGLSLLVFTQFGCDQDWYKVQLCEVQPTSLGCDRGDIVILNEQPIALSSPAFQLQIRFRDPALAQNVGAAMNQLNDLAISFEQTHSDGIVGSPKYALTRFQVLGKGSGLFVYTIMLPKEDLSQFVAGSAKLVVLKVSTNNRINVKDTTFSN